MLQSFNVHSNYISLWCKCTEYQMASHPEYRGMQLPCIPLLLTHSLILNIRFGECCAYSSVVIVNLKAFMMQPIHYANPVELLCDETVEISCTCSNEMC